MTDEAKKENPKPSPAIEGKFKVVGVVPGVIYSKKFGEVDLRNVSLEEAEKLVKGGFPNLEKIENKPVAAEKR